MVKPSVMSGFYGISRKWWWWAWLLLGLGAAINAAAAASSGSMKAGRYTLVLDPGHGGNDHGARSTSGALEKSLVLELAKSVRNSLSDRFEIILTRNDDYAVAVYDRTGAANRHRADLFISLHAGGALVRQARGMTVFFHKNPAARPKNSLENQPAGTHFWDQVQSTHRSASALLANTLCQHLEATIPASGCTVREAPLAVLAGADMPAVVIEIGYLTHPAEAEFLTAPDGRAAISQAVTAGIEDFMGN